MRSSVDAESPSWAVRSESPGSVAPTAARGSSLLRARPSRASGGTWSAPTTGASLGEPCAGPGDPQCVAQPAQLVHQADAKGVGPGPHPAPGDCLDLLHGPAASLRDLRDEVGVDRIQRGVELRALVVGEPLPSRVHQRSRTVGDRARGQPESLHQVAHDDLAPEYADGAGEGGGQGHDRVGRARDVVAPRRRSGPHRHDHRLACVADLADLAPDRVRGDCGSAGGVDVQDDRARVLVGGRGPQRGADRVAAHLAPHRAAGRASGRYRAAHLDEGDVPLAPRGDMRSARWRPPIGEEQLGVRPHARPHRGVGLIAVAHGVDQPVVERPGAVRGAVSMNCRTSSGAHPAALGDHVDRVGEDQTLPAGRAPCGGPR